MLGRKPVRAVGLNLGLRLYLLLVAIFGPTFLLYYVYTIRTIEMLHETEVEDVVRMTSLRIEDWTSTFGSLDHPGEKEPEALAQELLRISRDRDALAAELVKIAKEPESMALAVEILRAAKDPLAVAQELQLIPKEPELLALELHRLARERESQAQSLQRIAKERDALGRELKRIVSEPSGIESISVFGVTADGLLAPVANFGPSASGKPVAEDSDAVNQGRQQKIDILRGERQFQSVSVPLHVHAEIKGVAHLEVVPTRIGLGLRIREIKANLVLGATGLVLAVGFGVALFFHYSVRRPIRQLSDTMEDAAEGNLSALVDI